MSGVALGPETIGSWQADEIETARAIIKWLRKVNRKLSRELAAELKAGTMTAHEITIYVENLAGDLLPDGLLLTCQPVYQKDVPKLLDDNGEPIDRDGPIGYTYVVEETRSDESEDEVAGTRDDRTIIRKSKKPWLRGNSSKRRQHRAA